MKRLLLIVVFISCTPIFGQSHLSGEDKTEKTIQDIGDVLQIALPAGAALSTIIFKDKEGLWQLTKSYATTLALTYGLKYAINKPRPEGATDGHAFPSGHTSSAFSGASFIQRRYGWKYGAPAYALAGFVAYSRLEGYNDRHDMWDVLGGIVVGVGSTYIFTTPQQRDHYELSFKGGDDTYLLGLTYKF
ncbi:phosphatase PAP2 family protein [Ulvibacter antarcticus]|uniref:PAP2 superfamily protein n=1 Tax=Ulvibacter antarcticus TaxID=442714 RepID=A0A3L9YFL9_9FLAO|nr:phosphatase PAP2 family protein [Ulvibacter antarcticus]RMA57929.1 PAP2 superfamily protein [Ulvibacter antarcticus]